MKTDLLSAIRALVWASAVPLKRFSSGSPPKVGLSPAARPSSPKTEASPSPVTYRKAA